MHHQRLAEDSPYPGQEASYRCAMPMAHRDDMLNRPKSKAELQDDALLLGSGTE